MDDSLRENMHKSLFYSDFFPSNFNPYLFQENLTKFQKIFFQAKIFLEIAIKSQIKHMLSFQKKIGEDFQM